MDEFIIASSAGAKVIYSPTVEANEKDLTLFQVRERFVSDGTDFVLEPVTELLCLPFFSPFQY